MSYKSQNTKLYQVSSKSDSYNYTMKNIEWETPENAKNASGYMPVKLESQAASILEEKFIDLKDYLFTDEGDKVKVYVTFPESVDPAELQGAALEVVFDLQAIDVKLRTPSANFRMK